MTRRTDRSESREGVRCEFQARFERLEPRLVLSSIFPAYANGEFTFGDPLSPAPYGLENTFLLASKPSATKTIYLDYTGHHSVNNDWGHDIIFPAFDRDGDPTTFSNDELIEIQVNFQSVAEDYAPFDVNVTTIEPDVADLINAGGGDTRWGIRALQTQPTDGFGLGIGGVALLNSFSSGTDDPAFSFNKGIVNGSLTIAHEVGHTVGLLHDGLGGLAYHPGTGTGSSPTDWGPTMGAPFDHRLTQWSIGDYPNSTNTEDDFVVISTQNGFGLQPDDHGNFPQLATDLFVENDTEVSGWGFIDANTDVDYWKFETGSGTVTLELMPFGENPNLDMEVTLLNENLDVINVYNPSDELGVSIETGLAQGTYYLRIDGVGLDGVYSDYGSVGFYSIVGTIRRFEVLADFVLGESGSVLATNSWQTVSLDRSYLDPVVVVGPATYLESDPATVRVRNVTSNSFQVRVQEWTYLDGKHAVERLGYIVMEAGTHRLADGRLIIAQNTDGVDHTWRDVFFDLEFNNTPVILSQTTSYNGGAPVVTRINSANRNDFQIKLQEEEGADGKHRGETVSWIAIESTTDPMGESQIQAYLSPGPAVNDSETTFQFSEPFNDTPVFVANIQSYIGRNPVELRLTNLDHFSATVFAQEEQSADDETNHGYEGIGFVAIDEGLIKGRVNIGETGLVGGVTRQWKTVFLAQEYLDPVVVVSPATFNEMDPAGVRIRNVTSESFEVKIEEWNYLDLNHEPETISFMVFEAGVHMLVDGTIIEARNSQVNHRWKSIDFVSAHPETPAVFASVSSWIGRSTTTTRLDNVSESGFDIRLQEEEGADGFHSNERVSWISVVPGVGESAGKQYVAMIDENGVGDTPDTLYYSNPFFTNPVVLADMQTFNDSDPAMLRYTEYDNFGVTLFVQEEQSVDSEMDHEPEVIGLFAMERGMVGGITAKLFDDGPGGGAWGASAFAGGSGTANLYRISLPRITSIADTHAYGEMSLPFGEPVGHDHRMMAGSQNPPAVSDAALLLASDRADPQWSTRSGEQTDHGMMPAKPIVESDAGTTTPLASPGAWFTSRNWLTGVDLIERIEELSAAVIEDALLQQALDADIGQRQV